MTPDEILRENRRRAQVAAQEVGVARLRKMLERAQADLNDRIARAEGLRGAGADNFTAVRARMVLGQVRDVLRNLTGSMRDLLVEQAVDASEAQTASVLHYLAEGERLFAGTSHPLGISQAAVLDYVRQGAESSVLRRIVTDPSHRGHRGVLDRYGESVIGKFEEALQQRALTGKPWNEVREDLVKESPFLQQAPAHWAERIVRTESIAANNRASQEAMTSANDQLGGGMLKILCAAFDARTSWDSYQVHGQIRRVSEPFNDWEHAYMHPPNRPNDRETVVPHRIHWPVPLTLKPKSDGEVAARWVAEGRKGSPPPRPLMSTVDMAALAAEEVKRVEEQEKTPEVKPARAPKPPPAPKGEEWRPPSILKPARRVTRITDDRGSYETMRDEDGDAVPISQAQQEVFDRINLISSLANPKEIILDALVPNAVVDTRPSYLKPLKKAFKAPEKIREAAELKFLQSDDLAKVKFGSSTLDSDLVKSFAAHSHSLRPRRPLIVRYRGELHIHDGAELLLAKKTLGYSMNTDVDIVDLDVIDPPKIADKTKWRADLKRDVDVVLQSGDGTAVRDRIREILGSADIPSRDAGRGYALKFGVAANVARSLNHVPSSADIGGAMAVHRWDGSVTVAKSELEKVARIAAMDPAALKALPVAEKNAQLDGLSTLVHEDLHGASRIVSTAYRGVGVGIEEAGTEILARKITREHFEDPDVLKLPERSNWSGSYFGGYGSYQPYIQNLLEAVDVAYGDGKDVGNRVEEAFLKTRKWKSGEQEITSGESHIDEFVDALPGLTAAKRVDLKLRLKNPTGPLAP